MPLDRFCMIGCIIVYRPMCNTSWFLLDIILCCPSIVCDVINVHAYGCLTEDFIGTVGRLENNLGLAIVSNVMETNEEGPCAITMIILFNGCVFLDIVFACFGNHKHLQ